MKRKQTKPLPWRRFGNVILIAVITVTSQSLNVAIATTALNGPTWWYIFLCVICRIIIGGGDLSWPVAVLRFISFCTLSISFTPNSPSLEQPLLSYTLVICWLWFWSSSFLLVRSNSNTLNDHLNYPLRTVPTIVIAHTFCASPDTRISNRQCLLIQGYFCAV